MTEKTVEVSITAKEMEEGVDLILKAMNTAQTNGYTIDQVLMMVLYAAGAGIRQRGGRLLLDAPLCDALPPLVQGYNDSLGIVH